MHFVDNSCFKLSNFFTCSSWIAHGAQANEKYRSAARPAVFSHDRLTFTMANHLKEQRRYDTCILLVNEMERVIEEELRLRENLLKDGVRDVSNRISLPKNVLDKLDEESADYDDKRLCFDCKHICFFSCVACECSQSKVSCLRHSHFMCRCPTQRRYLMIWSTVEEMKGTLKRVKKFAEALKNISPRAENRESSTNPKEESALVPAPGTTKDDELHQNYTVDLSSKSNLLKLPQTGVPVLHKERKIIDDKDVSKTFSSKKRVKLNECQFQMNKPDPPEWSLKSHELKPDPPEEKMTPLMLNSL